MRILVDLYVTFFILGATSFGGGYAMLPILQRTVAQKKGWATEEELVDYFAIGQCTSGIIAVNVATFIGMKFQGVKGAVVATLGLVSPCLVIITVIATLFQSAASSAYFDHGFNGVKACVAVLIFGSAWTLVKKAVVDVVTGRIFYCTFVAMSVNALFPDLHPVLDQLTSPVCLILISGVVGYFVSEKEKRGQNPEKSQKTEE